MTKFVHKLFTVTQRFLGLLAALLKVLRPKLIGRERSPEAIGRANQLAHVSAANEPVSSAPGRLRLLALMTHGSAIDANSECETTVVGQKVDGTISSKTVVSIRMCQQVRLFASGSE